MHHFFPVLAIKYHRTILELYQERNFFLICGYELVYILFKCYRLIFANISWSCNRYSFKGHNIICYQGIVHNLCIQLFHTLWKIFACFYFSKGERIVGELQADFIEV